MPERSEPKVLVAWPQRDDILAPLAKLAMLWRWPGPGRCPDDIAAREVTDADAVLGNMRWTPGLLDQAPKLRVIALSSVGYDSVDIPEATRHGVIVTNTAGALTDTTADLAFALLLAVARRIGEGERVVRSGLWTSAATSSSLLGRDVHHATLGIVGLGRIGAEVAHRALGFHMRVLYFDAIRRESLEREHGYRFVDLDTLLRESDFVTLHVNLSDETRQMIGAAELAKMKPTAFLINAARGEVVDERALIAALREGRIAGAGVDAFEVEPPSADNPLLKMESVVVTPHVGSATAATREAMARLAVANVVAVLGGQPPITPVNPEVLSR